MSSNYLSTDDIGEHYFMLKQVGWNSKDIQACLGRFTRTFGRPVKDGYAVERLSKIEKTNGCEEV